MQFEELTIKFQWRLALKKINDTQNSMKEIRNDAIYHVSDEVVTF